MLRHIEKHGELMAAFAAGYLPQIEKAAELLAETFLKGGRLFICGADISSSLAEYAADNFIHHYKNVRPPLPAVNMRSAINLINSEDIDDIFEKQVSALVSQQDAVLGIATHRGAQSVIRALRSATYAGAGTIALVGSEPSLFSGVCDVVLAVEDNDSRRVQEIHVLAIHLLTKEVDRLIFNT